ncbi:MAG: CmpA/NrtA family ABC transporter substrate-binding protein [Opitutales bacterium]
MLKNAHQLISGGLLAASAFLVACGGGSSPEAEAPDYSDRIPTDTSGNASASESPAATKARTATITDLEKDELRFGFIKLTDCAPIVIAHEKGFFADEGLQVEVIAQPNWRTLLDNVINGELDGAHMLSGQPLAATIGFGTEAHIITAFTMDRNGNGITVANAIWERMQEVDPALDVPQPEHPITADSLKPIVQESLDMGQKLQMGMVFPVSTHNYEIRYWLASASIHPGMYTATDIGGRTDAEVELSVTPPPMMPETLESGNIQGYCVGEPWNQQAVARGIGVPVTTNYDIWQGNPEKVFGVTAEWAEEHPNTHRAVVRALIRAGRWLDARDADGNFLNREEACRILSRPNYVGANYDVIANSMTGFFYFQETDRRAMPEFNVFYDDYTTYPWYSDGIWFLTQMRRWGQITEPKPASWYHQVAKDVYRPDIYLEAARSLVEDGLIEEDEIPWDTDGYRPATDAFIDGITYDGRYPIQYLNAHQIGNKDAVQLAER